jgi:hypothetical protein
LEILAEILAKPKEDVHGFVHCLFFTRCPKEATCHFISCDARADLISKEYVTSTQLIYLNDCLFSHNFNFTSFYLRKEFWLSAF